MFGLGIWEIVALVVIALLVFGPEKLPQAASQAGKALRQLRDMANNARSDLEANLGPEFKNFDPADLNPKTFVRKHLLDDLERDWRDDREPAPAPAAPVPELEPAGPVYAELSVGEIPPYDNEAT